MIAAVLFAFEPLGTVAYRIAIGLLALLLAAAMVAVRGVPDARPDRVMRAFRTV